MKQEKVKALFQQKANLYGIPVLVNVVCIKEYFNYYIDNKMDLKVGDEHKMWVAFGECKNLGKSEMFFMLDDYKGRVYSSGKEIFEFVYNKENDFSSYLKNGHVEPVLKLIKRMHFANFEEMLEFLGTLLTNVSKEQRDDIYEAFAKSKVELPKKKFLDLSFEELALVLQHLTFKKLPSEGADHTLRLGYHSSEAKGTFISGYNEIFKEYVDPDKKDLDIRFSNIMFLNVFNFEGPNGEKEDLFQKVVFF